jgi:hypothetical protein
VNSASLTNDRNGNPNSSYIFDNTDNISIAHNNLFNAPQISISLWYNVIDYSSQTVVISKREPNGWGSSFELNLGTVNNLNAIGTSWSVGGNNSLAYENSSILTNQWYNFTYVWRSDSVLLYLNGDFVEGIGISGDLNFNTLPITIGSRGNGWHQTIGSIDDIGIWNRALNQQEITDLYNGCSNPPTATITNSGNTTFCVGGNVTLEANTGTNFTYQWYRNGVLIPNATNQTYLAEQTGSYTVSIFNGDCSAVSNAIQVTVNSLPNVTFNNIGNLVSRNANAINLSGTPSGGTFTGLGVSGSQFIPFNAGLGQKTLTYSYTDNNSCTNTSTQSVIVYDTVACSVSDTLIMDVLLSVNPLTYNVIKVYPNPSSTQLFIHTGNFSSMSSYTIRIYNFLGQEVYSTPISQQEYIIDVSTWSGYGTYFLHLVDGNGNSVEIKKIILQ